MSDCDTVLFVIFKPVYCIVFDLYMISVQPNRMFTVLQGLILMR